MTDTDHHAVAACWACGRQAPTEYVREYHCPTQQLLGVVCLISMRRVQSNCCWIRVPNKETMNVALHQHASRPARHTPVTVCGWHMRHHSMCCTWRRTLLAITSHQSSKHKHCNPYEVFTTLLLCRHMADTLLYTANRLVPT